MAQQYDLIPWQFSAEDYGTHSGNYLQKLKDLVTEYNGVLTAVNAQLVAAEDSAAIKSDIINLRDIDIAALVSQMTNLRNETVALRDAAEAIALADINGTSPDFLNVKINGVAVYHPGNKPSKSDVGLSAVNNTSDVDKPISMAAQALLDEIEILALAGIAL